MNIRTLMADEIECRVQTVKENGCSILLYKDARCDMRILDETFGIMGWQRKHELINNNLFCTISVWDEEKQMWISKQDVGVESYTEKEKGQASDSFKRACFNLGIGRELYTAPFIWIKLNSNDINKYNNKISVKTKFHVSEIAYNDKREIVALEIKDDKGNVRYKLGQRTVTETTDEEPNKKLDKAKVDAIRELARVKNVAEEYICNFRNVSSFEELEQDDWKATMEWLKKR